MQNPSTPKLPIDWVNTIFLILTPLIAIVGVPVYLVYHGFSWPSFVLFLCYMMVTGLAITAGYHRLFSHKTYQTVWPVRLFWLCFGAAAFQNSALKWSDDHRIHHQFVDTPRDPYNIKNGFWYAHILWIFYKSNTDYSQVPDLQKDPLVRFQHKHIFTIGTLFGLILPMAIATLWNDPWGGLLLAGVTRIVLNHHLTFFVNSLAHTLGTQPYSDQNSARDNWLMAFLTYGEGYHNFHHVFPSDYRNGVQLYHWDPAKWLIFALSKLRLATGLKRVAPQSTIVARIKKQEQKLAELFKTKQKLISEEWRTHMQQARQHFEDTCQKFYTRKAEYQKLKKQKVGAWRQNVQKHKAEMRLAKQQLKQSLRQWRHMYRGYRLLLKAC